MSETKDEERKRLFVQFMTARIGQALHNGSTKILGNQVDRKHNPVEVGIITETRFSNIAKDVCGSIEEYYDQFLTTKV